MTSSEPQQPAQEPAEQVKPASSLAEALLRVQEGVGALGLVPEAEGQVQNRRYKYVTIDKIMAAALPLLSANGLVWTTCPGYTEHEGRYEAVLNYLVVHVPSGGRMEGHMLLVAAKDDPQGQGAGISYARRQAFTAVFNITADEDDDGNRAAAAKLASQERQQEARAGATVLTDARRKAMLDAIREAGLDVAETLEKAGIDPDGDVTAAQSRQVRALIDAAKPVEGAS